MSLSDVLDYSYDQGVLATSAFRDVSNLERFVILHDSLYDLDRYRPCTEVDVSIPFPHTVRYKDSDGQQISRNNLWVFVCHDVTDTNSSPVIGRLRTQTRLSYVDL